MLPRNDLCSFAKYEVATTTRQSDGAKLIATRVVKDIALPVRWDVEYNDPKPFKPFVLNTVGPYSTSKIIEKAREAGFGEWHPLPEDAEPDTTDYLVD